MSFLKQYFRRGWQGDPINGQENAFESCLGADYWQSIFYYTSSVLDLAYVSEENLLTLFEDKLFINKEDIMRTIAQQIEERVEKQIEKGVEEKKAISIAQSMFKDGESLPKIMKWTDLSKEAIEQLKKAKMTRLV